MAFRAQLDEHLLDLAWRQWTALGVAGVQRGYDEAAIDPEALIILTATLAAADPRLRDESLDWCTRHGDFVSISRLRNLIRAAPATVKAAFAPYAATVNALSRANWPGAEEAKPWKMSPSGKSKLPTLQRPALLHLRLRALLGVSARADVVAAFLSGPDPGLSAADLVDLGYTKRNIAQTLDSLAAAGLLRATRVRNQIRFQLTRRAELNALLGPLPDRIPRWSVIMTFVIGLRELAVRLDSKSDTVCAVEAAKFLRTYERQIETLGLRPPVLAATPAQTWIEFQAWALGHTRSLALGKSPMLTAAR